MGCIEGEVIGVNRAISRVAVDEHMRPPETIEACKVVRFDRLLLHVVTVQVPSLAGVPGSYSPRRANLTLECDQVELAVLEGYSVVAIRVEDGDEHERRFVEQRA